MSVFSNREPFGELITPVGRNDPSSGFSNKVAREDHRHNIQETEWIPLTLLNGWVDYGGVWETAEYKLYMGRVEIKGVIKDGISPTVASLPVGFRPTKQKIFPIVTNPYALARITIFPNGTLYLDSYSNTYVSLEFSFLPGA